MAASKSLPPFAGGILTDEDLAKQAAADAGFQQKANAFVDQLGASGVDPRTLPRGEMAVSVAPQEKAPAGEAAVSQDVFLGTVLRFHMDSHGTMADIRVDKLVKGVGVQPGDTVQVWLGMQLLPNRGFTGGILGVDPFVALTMPGDQGVFLAKESPVGLSADTFAQAFLVDNGTVSADPQSPYGSLVQHVDVEAFLQSLG